MTEREQFERWYVTDAPSEPAWTIGTEMLDMAWVAWQAARATAEQSKPVNRIVARLKIEKLAALLTDTDRTKQDIVEPDGETVSGVRIGWGAWALLRAKIIDVIETKCEDDAVHAQAELTMKQIDAAMDAARFEYGHGVTRASIVAIHRALKSQQDAAIESKPAEQSRDSVEVAEIAENFSLKWIASPDDFPIGTKFYAGLPTDAEDAARWRYLAGHIEGICDSAELNIGRIAVLYRLDKYVLADIENGEVLAANIDAAIESQRSGKSNG